MSDLNHWLWLSTRKGLSPGRAMECVRAFGSVKALYYAGEDALRRKESLDKGLVSALADKDPRPAEKLLADCEARGISLLCIQDAAYPDRLRNLYDPPLVIYIKGRFPPVDDRVCVGVVGTRKATAYGLETAERLGRELAAQGAVLVTGIAEGIDSAAAKGALRAHGTVVAVLGTGVDQVYPAWNTRLQETIGKVGCLVSEYPPGTKASRHSFPQRNRIISGLSLGVAVVQAPQKSGALITAARAQEQGRDVFVIPGNVDDAGFAGSNDLIRDGAQLIRGGEDILAEYRARCPGMGLKDGPRGEGAGKLPIDKPGAVDYISLKDQLGALSETELKLVSALSQSRRYSDELIRGTGLPAGEVLAALTMLQLKGYVTERDGAYALVVTSMQ